MPFAVKTIVAAVAVSFATLTWNIPAFSHDCDNGNCGSHSHSHDHKEGHGHDGRRGGGSHLGLILGSAGLAAGGYALYLLHKEDFIEDGVSAFVEIIDEAIPGQFFISGSIDTGHQGLKFGIRY